MAQSELKDRFDLPEKLAVGQGYIPTTMAQECSPPLTIIPQATEADTSSTLLAGVRARKRPSALFWQCILFCGDSLILLTLLVSLLLLTPHLSLELQIAGNVLGIWISKLVLFGLALITWGCAVSATQAQKIENAAHPLKSVIYMLSVLVVMAFSLFFLVYPFISDKGTFVRILLFILALAALALGAWRIALAEVMNLPRFRRQAVIIGTTATGTAAARELLQAKYPATTVLGYIAAGTENQSAKDRLPVLGGRDILHHLVQREIVDMMVMTIDYASNPELFQEALELAYYGVSMVPAAVILEKSVGKVPVELLGDQWFGVLPTEERVAPAYQVWQKAVDVTFGLIGLVTLAILLPVLALVIRLDSPGPIFYSQERVGYRGRVFRILKFRSIRIDAERAEQAVSPNKNDARVTRVGWFLRKTHLDELPQVLSILRGDMTLIGPQAEQQAYIDQLAQSIPFYRCRLSVKPGLIGWAQVKCPYASTDHDALSKLEYDLYYIKEQSLMLDIRIILMTSVEVLLRRRR